MAVSVVRQMGWEAPIYACRSSRRRWARTSLRCAPPRRWGGGHKEQAQHKWVSARSREKSHGKEGNKGRAAPCTSHACALGADIRLAARLYIGAKASATSSNTVSSSAPSSIALRAACCICFDLRMSREAFLSLSRFICCTQRCAKCECQSGWQKLPRSKAPSEK